MDTLDELLNEEINAISYTDDELIVNADDRTIYIPNTLAGVTSDEKSTRLKLRCPRYVGDNIDLSTMNVYINFKNANGDIYSYLTDDVAVDGTDITFSWLLSRDVTTYKGSVNFIVCAKKIQADGKITIEWNTTLATLTVLEGLEPADNYIPTEKVDIATELMNAVNAVKAELNGVKESIPVVPTKVSAFENDSNYINTIPDEYVTEDELNAHANNSNIHVTTADKSKWNGKFDSNQGTSNAGKLLGTNSNGDVVTISGYGFEYDETTKMLKYGTDPTTNLNQGIGLDDTLSKKGYAADSASVGELKQDIGKLKTVQSNINWLPKTKHEGWGFWADGTVNKNNTNSTMSDYIRVNAGDIIFGYSPNNFNDCVFYDESYNLVQYMQWNPEPSGTIVPTGSKYMRFSVKKENYDTTKIYINPLDINIDNVETLKYTLNKIGNGIGDLHFDIHIKAGTYNITFTSDEINSAEYTADGFVGLVVGNNVNLIGESKDSTIISCEIATTYSASKRDAISTLNIKGNCKLENLTVKSKNIRYPIHDDFPQSIDTIHKIKNCSFIAGVNAVGQKTCGYGLGTRSGETIIFDNCYIEPIMIYHNNTGFTKSSLVTMNNCEISEVFNLWDFDCEVPCYLELNNIKCPQLNHSYNGTHEQTINISGIGSYPDIVTCSSDVKYFLGNCVKKQIHYGALSGKCMVDYYASNDPKFRTAATGTNGLLGIMLEDVGGDKIGIIQTNGYISANKLGATDMSSWSVGTLLKPNTNTAYLEPTTDISLAVAKVVFEIDSVKYIKLLF